MLSVITNFGCDTGCKYCIWKGHSLSKIKTTEHLTDWDLLKTFIRNHSKDEISVSGGGDPLFNVEKNAAWWARLMSVCDEMGTKVELHTSKFRPDWIWNKNLSRYVLHTTWDKYKKYSSSYIRLSKEVNKFRLVFVVTEDLTEDRLEHISHFCKTEGIELSFRQRVENGETNYHLHNLLLNGHKEKWYYIEQDDYNLYFMPDNKLYNKYQM